MTNNAIVMLQEEAKVYGGKITLSRPCVKLYGVSASCGPVKCRIDGTTLNGVLIEDERVHDNDSVLVVYTSADSTAQVVVLTTDNYKIEELPDGSV